MSEIVSAWKARYLYSKIPEPSPQPSSEHRISREEAEAQVNELVDNLIQAIKSGGEVPDYLRRTLVENLIAPRSSRP
jgi:hypothetical protein